MSQPATPVTRPGSTVVNETTYGQSPATGTALTYAREDHTHGTPPLPTATDVGLGNVTNDTQTKAAIVPNTAPSAGQILAGNAGGTAYAPVSVSGDFTLSSAGLATIVSNAVTTTKISNAAVTLAKIANAAASSKLLGSGASGSGSAYAEITLGTGLSMSGTTLNASGGSGTVTSVVCGAGLTGGTITTTGTVAIDYTQTATWTGLHTWNQAGVGTAITDAILLKNSTASTSGVQVQNSPFAHFQAHVWNTSTPADSQQDWQIGIIGTAGLTPRGTLTIQYSHDGGAYSKIVQLSGGGSGALVTVTSDTTVTGALVQSGGNVALSGSATMALDAPTITLGDSSAAVSVDGSTVTAGHQSATPSTTTINGLSGGQLALRGFIDGFQMSCTSTTTTLTTTAGACRDSTNVVLFSSAITSKVLAAAATWTVGNGGNLLDTGTVSASTWYHVYAIMKDSNGVGDIIASLSASSPTMPSGYTYFRRVGAIFADGSKNITQFFMRQGWFYWGNGLPTDFSLAITAGTAQLGTLSVPTGVNVQAVFNVASSALTKIWISCPDAKDETVLVTGPIRANFSSQGVNDVGPQMTVWTDTSARVRVNTGVNATIKASAVGWFDPRGQNA